MRSWIYPDLVTRREMLISASAAFAGVQSGAVRFGVRTPLPQTGLRERADLVRSLGYDGIELGPEWLDQPLEIFSARSQALARW